jgi:hypothetical protein
VCEEPGPPPTQPAQPSPLSGAHLATEYAELQHQLVVLPGQLDDVKAQEFREQIKRFRTPGALESVRAKMQITQALIDEVNREIPQNRQQYQQMGCARFERR